MRAIDYNTEWGERLPVTIIVILSCRRYRKDNRYSAIICAISSRSQTLKSRTLAGSGRFCEVISQ
jgi:hypothetical protein